MKCLGLAALLGLSVGCTNGPCTSGSYWTGGMQGSTLMTPGGDCTGCHMQRGEGPAYTVAGTVFFDYADADDCNGVDGAEVVVTDANGTEYSTTANAAGNFFLTAGQANPTWPAKVEVRYNGGVLPMAGEITDGQCNVCHTADGAQNAPGRVIVP